MRRVAGGIFVFFSLCGCQLAFSTLGSWTKDAGPPSPITTNHVVALPDGRVAFFGGFVRQTGQPSNQTLLYDPSTNAWTKGAVMPDSFYPDVVALLHDGTVLVEGGMGQDNSPRGLTSIYDPLRNSWSRTGSLIQARVGPAYALLTDGRLLIAGGGVPLPQPIQMPNGTIDNFQSITSAEIFDPHTGTWSLAGNLDSARNGISLTALPDGRALAAGGCQGSSGFTPPVATAEVFDPATASWSSTTQLPAPICGATGVALRDGRALILDQYLFNSSGNAFLYDPKSARWSDAGGLAGGGTGAVLLNDGRVLVPETRQGTVHGHTFDQLVGAQIFDPASNQWLYATTASVLMPITYLSQFSNQLSVSLPNGNALVFLPTATLTYDARVPPPATEVMDSTGLTFELGAAVVVIVLLLLLAYRRASRVDVTKLA